MPCAGCGQKQTNPVVPDANAPAPSVSASSTAPTPYFGGPRTSCVECVMKHLGQAWVLYSEYKAGYPYKLLIIGHLAEAECESESWPPLHMLIREQRKRFIEVDIPPDFDFLGLKVLETKQFMSEFMTRSR